MSISFTFTLVSVLITDRFPLTEGLLHRETYARGIKPEMYAGILNTLDKEQIPELLAYVISTGKADHAAFKE